MFIINQTMPSLESSHVMVPFQGVPGAAQEDHLPFFRLAMVQPCGTSPSPTTGKSCRYRIFIEEQRGDV